MIETIFIIGCVLVGYAVIIIAAFLPSDKGFKREEPDEPLELGRGTGMMWDKSGRVGSRLADVIQDQHRANAIHSTLIEYIDLTSRKH
jgi:hypothetical protein